jgi:hypothetical protein
MLSLTPHRFALAALATVGLFVCAGMLLSGSSFSGPDGVAGIGPAGCLTMSVFATSCAASAAWAAQSGQRLAWIVLAVGLGGWAIGNAVWFFVSLGGVAPISATSIADLGYVVLPLCALIAALVVPSHDDSRFGIGLLLDGLLVAASLLMVLGVVARSRGARGELSAGLVGHHHRGVPRACRDDITRHTKGRAGPQALTGAAGGGLRGHRGGRASAHLYQQSRPAPR